MPTVQATGVEVEVPEGSSVEDLLRQLGLGARIVVVERNGSPVDRAHRATTLLADGDHLELVRAVAGG